MNTPLTEDEVSELAKVFPAGPSAAVLLDAAGFPDQLLPAPIGLNSLEFWSQVNKAVRSGVAAGGRADILRAASARYPENPVFNGRAIRRVLVVGANPDGLPPLHADRDLHAALAVCQAAGIRVAYCPAARVTDLDAVLRIAPHLLHLACHGDGEHLIFEEDGRPVPVLVTAVTELLGAYADRAGIRLSGIYLASCHSAEVAELFTAFADVVVAFSGELPDRCGIAFAEQLYRLLPQRLALDAVAALAVRTVAAARPSCGNLAQRLLVLPGTRTRA
jgi:hypothetical protein